MAEFDVASLEPRALHKLIIQTVIPRPIAFVSTESAAGAANLAPFSFFNAFSSAPPILAIGVGSRGGVPKDTLANILATREFVVNLVTDAIAAPMVATSAEVAHGVDEFAESGLTRAPSKRVRPARVAESPVSWECVLFDTIPLDRSRATPPAPVSTSPTTMVLGEVVHIHVDDRVITDRARLAIDPGALAPIARLGGITYARQTERFDMARPARK